MGESRRRVRAAVMTLSEGGLSLEAPLRVEQGDSLRICLLPHRKARAIHVEGIAWNDRPSRNRAGRLRMIGVVVSDPPAEFLDLLAEVERQNPSGERASGPRAGRPSTRPRPAAPTPSEDLPRSRAPLPPPKPEPEETLPKFRVRFKLAGGPRTRILSVQATAVGDAVERAQAELAASSKPDEEWELLEVTGS